MKKNSVFILLTLLAVTAVIFLKAASFAQVQKAQEKPQQKATWDEKAIGATFKTLGKAFISTTDLKKLKQDNIKKIKRMDEEKFRSRYSDYFNIINRSPLLQSKYRLSGNMTRQQAIEKLNGLNKKELCDIVDSVPDSVIAQEFKRNVGKYKSRVESKDFPQKINYIWGRIREKVTGLKNP
jgi:hypothetical protein